jgi:flavin-dependent dehydrogenase
VTIERRVLTPGESAIARIAGTQDRPSFVLDCSGRTGLIARARNLRRYEPGPTTVALAGQWRSDTWHLPDNTHTVVESYADGWMWSVPTADGIRHVSAMIDPQRSDLVRGGSSRDVYLSEIGKTRAFKRLLETASLASGPSGWDASTYGAREYAGDDWLLVGDAASFIDPLSSAGVKKALASAWLAAVAVHTCLKTPSMRRHALDFYSAREREIERHHAAESRAFLANAARRHDRPFWAERSEDPGNANGGADEVRRAFDQLKSRPALRVVVPPAIRIEPRPLVDGHEIVMAPHVVPSNAAAARYLHGVDVVRLLELAPTVSHVPDLFELYARQGGPVPLHDFLLALSTAVARGWLVSE